jgi:YD repeat-containing protein
MTLAQRITALAQAMGADIKALFASVNASMPDAVAVAYTSGRITSVTADGVTTTVTYNADGTVHTISYPIGSLTRTETYSYSGGLMSGMTAVEA